MNGTVSRTTFAAAMTAVLCLAWGGASPAFAAQRVALVIGNATYAHVPALANPLNDAKDVGAALDRLGFAVTRIENTDRASLWRGLQDFALAASASEIAVVFYAGHGIEVDQRNFLVPVDARLASDQDVEFEAVPLELVSRAVERASGLRLVILDACRENPFAVQMQRAGATRSIGRGLARVEPSGETLIAYAAKEGTVASDGAGRNSPYSEALLGHLEEPGLEVGLMFRKVRDAVVGLTGGRQEPFVYGSLSSRGVYLAAAAAPPAGATVTSVQPSGAEESGSSRVVAQGELLFWESVKDSEDPADIRVYLDHYPGGTYEALARNRLKRLDATAKDIVASEPTPQPSSLSARMEEARLAAEQEFWVLVKETEVPSDLEAYLEQYPNGVYAPLARIRLRQLQRMHPAPKAAANSTAAVPTPKESSDAVAPAVSPVSAPTPQTVESSLGLERLERRQIQRVLASLGLGLGPADGLFGQRTRLAIRTYQKGKGLAETGYLTGEQAEALLELSEETKRRADDAAYAQAQSSFSQEAYGMYLRDFPDGRHVVQARERASALRAEAERAREEARRKRAERETVARKDAERRADDAAFAQAKSVGTPESYQEYLESFPGGRHFAEARRLRAEVAATARLVRKPTEPGTTFRDCAECPQMVVIPVGSYTVRNLIGMEETYQGRVTFAAPLGVGVYEITFAEWDACRREGGCTDNPGDEGWGRDNRPVINVSWKDAQNYLHWLSNETGYTYRLLSEFEWEYAARGGTATHFHWGNSVGRNQANCKGCGSQWDGEQTSQVGEFAMNAYGLHDVHGNVREWVEDCWSTQDYSYGPARGPMDGSPRLARHGGNCSKRLVRGGAWNSTPMNIRSAKRWSFLVDERRNDTGFRVARTLDLRNSEQIGQ